MTFQSLQGIWFDRDRSPRIPPTKGTVGFNPYKGFGSIATTTMPWLRKVSTTAVSIPTRDLVRSRRHRLRLGTIRIQLVSIPTRDLVRSRRWFENWWESELSFQSLQGIWFDRDSGHSCRLTKEKFMFQSLQGIWFDRDPQPPSRRWARHLFQSLQGIWFDRDIRSDSFPINLPTTFQSLQGIWFDRDMTCQFAAGR